MRRALGALLASICLLASFPASAASAPSDAFGPADAIRALQTIRDARLAQREKGWGGAASTDYALSTLALLGELDTEVPRGSRPALCDTLNGWLATADDNDEDVYHAARSLALLGCSTHLSSDMQRRLGELLASSSLVDVYFGFSTALSLVAAGGAKLGDFDFKPAMQLLNELDQGDGTFAPRGNRKKSPSASHAGLALEILGGLMERTKSEEAIQRMRAGLKLADVGKVVSAGVSSGFASKKHSPVVVAARILAGIQSMLSGSPSEKPTFAQDDLENLAGLFLSAKTTRNLHDLYSVVAGVHFLAHNNVARPIAVRVEQDVKKTSGSAAAAAVVVVSDVMGRAIGDAKVRMESASLQPRPWKKQQKSSNVLAGGGTTLPPVGGSKDGRFLLELPSSAPVGTYKVLLKVEGAPVAGQRKFVADSGLLVRKATSLRSLSLEVGVAKSAQQRAKASVSVEFPSTSSEILEADHMEFLVVKLSMEFSAPLIPSQAFLALRPVAGGDDVPSAIFVPSLDAANSSEDDEDDSNDSDVASSTQISYTAKVELADATTLSSLYGPGQYVLEVILGDECLQKVTTHKFPWRTVTLQLNLPASSGVRFARQPEPLPAIAHTFAPDESQPFALISLSFTLLVLAPLGVFFGGMVFLGAHRLQLPKSASHWLSALIFQGSILAMLLAIFVYWIGLNIFQSFAVLAVLSMVAIFSGNVALRAHSLERTRRPSAMERKKTQ